MRQATDISGRRFGRLTAIRRSGTHPVRKGALWTCLCDCGGEAIIEGRLLRDGTTASCGCRRREGNGTHRQSFTITYTSWRAMLKRCTNENHEAYDRYAGRGIGVCERWLTSFENFLSDMGERPSSLHSLDRIDNDKGYEPGNCRWADQKTQQRNRRDNVRITFNGETKIASDWARKIGITPTALCRRLAKGWELKDALTFPPQKGVRYVPAATVPGLQSTPTSCMG